MRCFTSWYGKDFKISFYDSEVVFFSAVKLVGTTLKDYLLKGNLEACIKMLLFLKKLQKCDNNCIMKN